MTKNSITTRGITVSVAVQYEPNYSDVFKPEFAFSYRITITNNSAATVQLLHRYWLIFQGDGIKRVVEGAGVVGEQPIIRVGHSYTYSSWCPIQQPVGYMEGKYLMQNTETAELFEVKIPRFEMISTEVLN